MLVVKMSGRVALVVCILFSATSCVTSYQPRQIAHTKAHHLKDGDSYAISSLTYFDSLYLKAKIAPVSGTGELDFSINFFNHGSEASASSISFLLTGATCTSPLDFSIRQIDRRYVYSYQSLFAEFSPFAEIDLELIRSAKENGEIVYTARVNDEERTVKLKAPILNVSMSVTGADIYLSEISLIASK